MKVFGWNPAWIVLALWASCCGWAWSQETGKPGPEHEVLKHFEGTWDAVVKFEAEKPQVSKGVGVFRLECGGMWLVSEFTGEFGGAKFQGRGIDGYDQEKKKYFGVWVDSLAPSPTISDGTYDPQEKSLTFLSTGKGPDGKPTQTRSVTSLKEKDRLLVQMFTKAEEGTEQLLMTIEYSRRR
jgi:hypothetical protein